MLSHCAKPCMQSSSISTSSKCVVYRLPIHVLTLPGVGQFVSTPPSAVPLSVPVLGYRASASAELVPNGRALPVQTRDSCRPALHVLDRLAEIRWTTTCVASVRLITAISHATNTTGTIMVLP